MTQFHGPNLGYVLELYDRYLQDPNTLDPETRAFFAGWTPQDGQDTVEVARVGDSARPSIPQPAFEKIVGAVNYVQALRAYGDMAAQLDPLGSTPPGDPALELSAHGLTADDLRALPASIIGGPLAQGAANAWEATERLRAVYCGTIGYDFEHLHWAEEREWFAHAAENGTYRAPAMPMDTDQVLEQLTRVEAFEQFLHRVFPGKHRFSIEGLDTMVPMMNEIIAHCDGQGIRNVLIGMAHRGRLNVLAHVMGKKYSGFLAEFKDPISPLLESYEGGFMGDVKYHLGATKAIAGKSGEEVVITMAPNPSHLELVNPVVEGMARAAGTSVHQRGKSKFDPVLTLPILIHGDAAFPGQGIVAETLNLSRLPGYWTGGTIHIIANNQLGYTVNPVNSRSTLYASDMARGFQIPIIHVNADDPLACIEVARIASAYRARFHKDVLIDLVGYRRYGHNEGDEPAFTQPVLYQTIRSHPTVRTIFAEREGKGEQAEAMLERANEDLQAALAGLDLEREFYKPEFIVPEKGLAARQKTAVSVERLNAINDALRKFPEGFSVHSKLQKMVGTRREAFKDPSAASIDWATAEELAFATILEDGIAIRMTGQDVERGTFNQRHAVFHDVETGERFVPLHALPQASAAFEIQDSPLSEAAAIGFEYGYSTHATDRMVIWEAQYGDFINGAQNVIDEYVVSARDKWGQSPSLVLLLPHGYEGAGPDHSTGRLERFLNMAADVNMRVANCTTAAQYFHLLRRQAMLLESDPLPLVIMTPKSLLRHPMVASPMTDLTTGYWQPIIDDARARQTPADIRRLVLCSGKIFVDLMQHKGRENDLHTAVVRVEQLYPLNTPVLNEILDGYPNLETVVWAQEEPENAGAWEFMRPNLERLLDDRDLPLHYIGRPRRSSPAEGSLAWHLANQEKLLNQIYSYQPSSNGKTGKSAARKKAVEKQ